MERRTQNLASFPKFLVRFLKYFALSGGFILATLFIGVPGVLLSPLAHRILHFLHLEK